MPNTARTVRCRKCHTPYDHMRSPKCPRCGAPGKPTTTSSPAVPPAGAAPAARPKKERMTPLMKIASKGEALVYGTPSVNEPVQQKKGRERKESNNTPIVVGGVAIVAIVIGVLFAMNNNETSKKGKKPQQTASEGQKTSHVQTPAPSVPVAAANQPPAQPDKNIDPLDAEAKNRHLPPAQNPPSDNPPLEPPRPRVPVQTWKCNQAVKAELEPLLKEMNDWPTPKINDEVANLKGRAQDAIPALIELIDTDDDMAANWACQLLQRLTGRNMGAPMGMSRTEKRELSEKWKSTYLANGAAPQGPSQEAEDEKTLNQGLEWARKFSKCRFPGDDDKCVKDLCATGDKALVKGLILVVGADDKSMATSADKMLHMLTGQDMGGSSAKWLDWWKANESSWKFPN